ncbi:MAG TPA: hypothetical protein VK658_01755 [Chryseolinea sp.]|nr:hypothetical protein [Chryseolinea sp.]
MTKFTTKGWLIILVPIMLIGGTWALIILFQDIENKTQDKINAMYFVVPIVVLVFFGLPVAIMMYKRTIFRDNGRWTISYLILKKQIEFSGTEIEEISITENISGRSVPTHEIMRIRTHDNRKMEISSLELRSYTKLRELMLKDFKGKAIITQFGQRPLK